MDVGKSLARSFVITEFCFAMTLAQDGLLPAIGSVEHFIITIATCAIAGHAWKQ